MIQLTVKIRWETDDKYGQQRKGMCAFPVEH